MRTGYRTEKHAVCRCCSGCFSFYGNFNDLRTRSCQRIRRRRGCCGFVQIKSSLDYYLLKRNMMRHTEVVHLLNEFRCSGCNTRFNCIRTSNNRKRVKFILAWIEEVRVKNENRMWCNALAVASGWKWELGRSWTAISDISWDLTKSHSISSVGWRMKMLFPHQVSSLNPSIFLYF